MNKTGKGRRIIHSGLALSLMITVVLAGCSDGKPKTGEPAASSPAAGAADPFDKLPKEISITTLDRGQVSSDEGTYENNRWTKWINENSGVKVNWVPVSRNQSFTRFNTMFASGEAPDVVWEYDRNYVVNLAQQGLIQPLDDYLKYAPNIAKYLEDHAVLKPYLTIDGKLYAIAAERDPDASLNHGIWIRQDWLDKLGLKMPTTIDELMVVAHAFKDKDPDGNGKADTVGFAFTGNEFNYTNGSGGLFAALYNAFGSDFFVDNGKLVLGRMLDRYTDVLALRKNIYDNGLIDKEYVTDKNNAKERQLWVTGKAGIYLSSWTIEAEYADLMANDPNAKPVPLSPPSTKYGQFAYGAGGGPSQFYVMNKSTKNPKAVMEFFEWLFNEGAFTLAFGFEGTHYKLLDGKVPQSIDAEKTKKEVTYSKNSYALMLTKPTFSIDNFKATAASDPISQSYVPLKTESFVVNSKVPYKRIIPFNPPLPELTDLLTQFNSLVSDNETKVIMGGSQYTPQWGVDEFRKEWKRLGGDNVDKLVQDWYEKNKDSLK
ncbi:MAG: hypothetical protein K0R57_1992 [Paenibacillaceae bacterium]|jgi:putative aldouronate transport system substrate-binding protein|nr:hypothetical protein [Paenibacillaceae bacterium]